MQQANGHRDTHGKRADSLPSPPRGGQILPLLTFYSSNYFKLHPSYWTHVVSTHVEALMCCNLIKYALTVPKGIKDWEDAVKYRVCILPSSSANSYDFNIGSVGVLTTVYAVRAKSCLFLEVTLFCINWYTTWLCQKIILYYTHFSTSAYWLVSTGYW